LILSGITEEEWRHVSRAAALLEFGLEDVDNEGEWRTGWFRRFGRLLGAPLNQ
jgi:ribosomal protein L11 methylase PrmA